LQGKRYLLVVADDFGIGPATSRGIVDLAARGRVTGTVLLVNSPHAEDAVRLWRQAGGCPELGWHPCLTLDAPVLPPGRVPSLVTPEGRFWPLGVFLRRLLLRRVRPDEVEAELRAQHRRVADLVGRPPGSLNGHHHIHVFPPLAGLLARLLARQRPPPYVRRVREPWKLLLTIPGARTKRAFLSCLGRRSSRGQARAGLPGNDWLAGITDPPWVADPLFLARWLTRLPGRVVELTCHPGHLDPTLVGRDCTAEDGQLLRRVREYQLLSHASFDAACRASGFTLVSPGELIGLHARGEFHAA
jgi:predicted glycoside hydrolase/deacetylase ChbG (UPF0249 family)